MELLTHAFKTFIYIAFIFATLSAQVASNTTLPEYLQGNTYLKLMITGLGLPTLTFSNARNL